MDRVLASEAKGRGFDPRQPHQISVSREVIAYIDVWIWLRRAHPVTHERSGGEHVQLISVLTFSNRVVRKCVDPTSAFTT